MTRKEHFWGHGRCVKCECKARTPEAAEPCEGWLAVLRRNDCRTDAALPVPADLVGPAQIDKDSNE